MFRNPDVSFLSRYAVGAGSKLKFGGYTIPVMCRVGTGTMFAAPPMSHDR